MFSYIFQKYILLSSFIHKLLDREKNKEIKYEKNNFLFPLIYSSNVIFLLENCDRARIGRVNVCFVNIY